MVSQFGSLGDTIMGKTADLTAVQKTIIDTLHKEDNVRGVLPGLSRRNGLLEKKKWTVAQWSKVLFSDESKFCISFGNQGPRVWRKGGEAHSPSYLKSSVKFPQSVMIWGAMSSAGVDPL
ncbi:Transposable element Tc1 transposase [Labeo rohita]|uniref:Transposable element Tc1 transposase n=1 Tax=Labeo rohita TaxID=84645 RepID=A0ABQ8LTA9_LABRO|nr:Transposable element Tc1 transposase [Labeo rohita]